MTYRIILLLAVALFAGLGNVSGKKKKTKTEVPQQQAAKKEIDYRQSGAPIPDIIISRPDGSVFTNAQIDKTKNFILVMFNPTCGHCEQQAVEFLNHYEDIKDLQMQWAYTSNQTKEAADNFIKTYATKGDKKLNVGMDANKFIEKTFSYVNLPQINIYDKNQKLIKMFAGGVSVDTLYEYLP